jgi:hypothetical protein
MPTKKSLQIAVIGLAVLAVLAVVSIISTDRSARPSEVPQAHAPAETITLSIEGLYISERFPVPAGQTLLAVLQNLNAQDARLQLQTKEYAGLGVLIESMNGMTNGTDNEYWQYRVNGVMPQVGADVFQITNGDTIEWYFERSEF